MNSFVHSLKPVQQLPPEITLDALQEIIQKNMFIITKINDVWFIPDLTNISTYPSHTKLRHLPIRYLPSVQIDDELHFACSMFLQHSVPFILVLKKHEVLGALPFEALSAFIKTIEFETILNNLICDEYFPGAKFLALKIWYHKKVDQTFHINHIEVFGNPENILGLSQKLLSERIHQLDERIHSEDLKHHPLFTGNFTYNYERSFPFEHEYRYIHPEGRELLCRERGCVLYDEQTREGMIFRFIQDRTTSHIHAKKQEFEEKMCALFSFADESDILERFLAMFTEFMSADYAFILSTSETRLFHIHASLTPDPDFYERLKQTMEKYGFVGQADQHTDIIFYKPFPELPGIIQTGEIRYVEDTNNLDDPPREIHKKLGISSLILIPVGSLHDEHFLLEICYRTKTSFSSILKDILQSIQPILQSNVRAWLYSIKLRELSRSLHEKVKLQTHEIEMMYSLAHHLGFALNYEELLDAIAKSLHTIISYDAITLLIVENSRGTIYMHQQNDLKDELIQTIIQHMTKMYGKLTGREINIYHKSIQRQFQTEECTIDNLQSSFIVPIFIMPEGKLVGLLYVGARQENAFHEGELRILYNLAHQISLAIARIQSVVQEEILYLQTVVNTVHDALLLVDSSHHFILSNPAGEEFVKEYCELSSDMKLEKIGGKVFHELVSEGNFRPCELEIGKDEKEIFTIHISNITSGQLAGGYVLVIRNVTREKELERKAQLQSRLAAIGQLSAGMAHDLNNLLTPIYGFADLLLQKPDLPENIREPLSIIAREAEHASNFIKKILDFARASLHQKQYVNLVPYMKEFVRMLQRTLTPRIHVEFLCREEELTAYIDPASFQDVLMNLALNARDAMPNGGRLRFMLSLKSFQPDTAPFPGMEKSEWVCLEVSDTGCGIAPEHLPHIFEPFYTTKEKGKGTGLGLSQVYGIIKSHDGYIDVESEVDKGTTFFIYLPAVYETAPPTPAQSDVEPERLDIPLNVLLVEDQPEVRKTLKTLLESLKCTVFEFTTVDEAFAFFLNHRDSIDILLVDWILPGRTGGELIKRVREHTPNFPAILITGYIREEDMEEMSELENVPLLIKPIKKDDIVKAFRKVLHMPHEE